MGRMVSACMITGKTENHRSLANIAVGCFLRQSHLVKELVIINTSPTAPWFSHLDTHHIREIVLKQGKQTLGDLRNRSLDEAHGDYVIQWDDDDWHHPDRITKQLDAHYACGRDEPNVMTILQSQYRLDVRTKKWGRVNAGHWRHGGIVGTAFHPRSDLRYPSMKKAEDTEFTKQFVINVLDNDPKLYVRTFHGDNTWHRAMVMRPALKTTRTRFQGDSEFMEKIIAIYDNRVEKD